MVLWSVKLALNSGLGFLRSRWSLVRTKSRIFLYLVGKSTRLSKFSWAMKVASGAWMGFWLEMIPQDHVAWR